MGRESKRETRKKYQYRHICNWYMISSSCHDPVRPRIKHGSARIRYLQGSGCSRCGSFFFHVFFIFFHFFSLLFFSSPHCRVPIAGTMTGGSNNWDPPSFVNPSSPIQVPVTGRYFYLSCKYPPPTSYPGLYSGMDVGDRTDRD